MLLLGIYSRYSLFLLSLLIFCPDVNAFPLKLETPVNWVSEDRSEYKLTGPQTIEFFEKTNGLRFFRQEIGEGGMASFSDFKTKSGGLKVDTIIGDPLAVLSGPIESGSGTIHVNTEGIPNLFPSATINLELVRGFIETGITLPGNQLVGPDGNDTFMSYTSTWRSLDPIGRSDNGFDLVLGEFSLNSVGRPSTFSYTLNPDQQSGHMNFTISEAMLLGTGTTIVPGTVTKDLTFQIAPEPSSFILLSSGLIWLMRRWHRSGLA